MCTPLDARSQRLRQSSESRLHRFDRRGNRQRFRQSAHRPLRHRERGLEWLGGRVDGVTRCDDLSVDIDTPEDYRREVVS
jgi:hypothetical protein